MALRRPFRRAMLATTSNKKAGRELTRNGNWMKRGQHSVMTLPELAADALEDFLRAYMRRRFSSTQNDLIEIVPMAARIALECIGNSDALYHNVEHTMLVTLAGHEILRGRVLHTDMSADDYAHIIIACLAHDIGYVRGLFREDDEDGFVIDASGQEGDLAARLVRRRPDALPCRPVETLRDGAAGKFCPARPGAHRALRSRAPGFRRRTAATVPRRPRSSALLTSSGSSAIPIISARPMRSITSSRRSASTASSAMTCPPTSSTAIPSSTGTAWRPISRPRSATSTRPRAAGSGSPTSTAMCSAPSRKFRYRGRRASGPITGFPITGFPITVLA